MSLAGKVALVSGAAGGIGKETVRALTDAGAIVAAAVETDQRAAEFKNARPLDVRWLPPPLPNPPKFGCVQWRGGI